MIVTLGNLYYYPLKLYVFIMGYLYFRKLRVVGRKNIPLRGPLIFAINHQNALLDALLLSVVTWRNAHFMTRADVFNKPMIDKFLRGLKMLPIYRIRDGYDSVKRNDATFDSANKILQGGGVVGIFPEGSHSLNYKVRPLKKGVARIAFMAEEYADFDLNLKVIPIGIQYESHFDQKGRTLITFGEPIKVADFKDSYLQDKNKGMEQLISEISGKLKRLVLNVENPDYEKVLNEYKRRRVYKAKLTEQLKADQKLVDAIETGDPFTEKPSLANPVSRFLGFLWRLVWKVIAYIPITLTDKLVQKTTKDPHFYGTMRFAFSLFTYQIFFLLVYFLIRGLVS